MHKSAGYSGIVTSVDGKEITITLDASAARLGDKAESCAGCGIASFCNSGKCSVMTVKVMTDNPDEYTPGMKVSVKRRDKGALLASWYLFALPTLALVTGMAVATELNAGETAVAISGIASAAGLFIILKLLRVRLQRLPIWKISPQQ